VLPGTGAPGDPGGSDNGQIALIAALVGAFTLAGAVAMRRSRRA